MIVFSTLMAQKNIFVDFIFLYTFFLLFSSSRNSFNCYAILLWATKNAVTVTYTNTKQSTVCHLQVPLISILVTCLLCSILSLLLDLETLVQFMSIGTLTAYSFVAACVILLRYGAVSTSTPSATSKMTVVMDE